jgi:hypothetical protein
MTFKKFNWIFLGLLLTIGFNFSIIRGKFEQFLVFETLSSISENSQCLSATLTPDNISQVIKQNQLLMNIVIDSKQLKNVSVNDSSDRSYSVFALAVNIFRKGDSMLRMIVDRQRLESIKGNSYIDLQFRCPVKLNIATGGNLDVSSIVIPLSEAETTPEWNFYYSHDSHSWFALRWTNPDAELLRQVKQEILSIL